MTRFMIHKGLVLLVAAALLSTACPAVVFAQSIALSPEQERLLNQLPPSQRDAALRQLQNLAKSNRSAAGTDDTSGSQAPDEREAEEPLPESSIELGRFQPGSTLLLTAGERLNESVDPDLLLIERQTALDKRILAGNPYRLDEAGRLNLPGIDSISLAGLNEDQASLRVSSEPSLLGLAYEITLLPLTPVGNEALEYFGYKLFNREIEGFGDGYAVPVPADYPIGPGDTLRMQLFGNKNAEYELQVERDGAIQFPELGPLNVGGMTFGQLRDFVRQRVSEQFIGTQISISMGNLRLIQVFLVGDVNSPGAYTVGSLSTVTTVLAAGGGLSPNGTLRNIQLKRNGEVTNTLDVYNLLLRGDARGDVRVQPGDVVFVPPVGPRVSIAGEVRRPAIYEYRGATEAGEAVDLAGGLAPDAMLAEAKIERLDPDNGIHTIGVNLRSPDGRQIELRDGDKLFIPSAVTMPSQSVRLEGNVQRPGAYQWWDGMRLSDLIPGSYNLKPGSDLHYVLVRREPEPNIGPDIVSADLSAAWRLPGSEVDLRLQSRDTVYVLDLQTGREQYVTPLIAELEQYSTIDEPAPIVSVGGRVNSPGQFPAEYGMRVADLVRAGGGLSQSAYIQEAELTRHAIGQDGSRLTVVQLIDLEAAMAGDPNANIPLQPFDYLSIREIPNWRGDQFVEIAGEVAFPGTYPIRQGEALSSVIERAGGLTQLAFPRGSVFTRKSLQMREREQIEVLANRLERDIASLSLSGSEQADALNTGESLLSQLRSTKPVGRLVIDLEDLASVESEASLTVRDGDTLVIPQRAQEVTVLGEVQYATSHLFDEGLNRDEYVQRSGGMTSRADAARIYVVRANGEVVANSRSRFFARSDITEIQPGDTIVVPLDTDRIRPLTLWSNVTQIVYNLAIAAAAVSRF